MYDAHMPTTDQHQVHQHRMPDGDGRCRLGRACVCAVTGLKNVSIAEDAADPSDTASHPPPTSTRKLCLVVPGPLASPIRGQRSPVSPLFMRLTGLWGLGGEIPL